MRSQSRKPTGWNLPAGTTNRHQWWKGAANALNELCSARDLQKNINEDGDISWCWLLMSAHNKKAVEIYDFLRTRHGGEINKGNAADIEKQALEYMPEARAAAPVKDNRKTPEEKAERDAKVEEFNKKRETAAAEKSEQVETLTAELHARYPWALTGEGMSNQARAARNIKKELQREFPGVFFSVKSSSFAGGDSVVIHYENGPATENVEAITDKYSSGTFDPMTDCGGYDSSAYGKAVDAVLGRSKYVRASRDISNHYREQIARKLCEEYGEEFENIEYQSIATSSNGRGEYLGTLVHQAVCKVDIPAGGECTGIEFPDCFPRAVFTEPETPARSETLDGIPTGATITKHYHTKKERDFWLVIASNRVERPEFVRLRTAAKAAGGWYSHKWGKTPGGFAFWEQADAVDFWRREFGPDDTDPEPTGTEPGPTTAGSYTAGEYQQQTSRATRPNTARAEKFRTMAEKTRTEAEGKRGNRQENTPKRQREAGNARAEAARLDRVAVALELLAEFWEAGEVSPLLLGFTSKKGIYTAMSCKRSHERTGYYDYQIDSGQPPENATPEALALWALLSPPDPEKIAADELARELADLKNCQIPGYFPTPPELVARMIEAADIGPADTVLEPSAGSGAIYDAIPPDNLTVCYEINPRLCEILKKKGIDAHPVDFMEQGGNFKFNKILMNPPFEKLQDIDHVLHAFDRLANGGRIVAIMSPGPFTRADKKATAFRNWLDTAPEFYEVTDLDAGTFKSSGTGVASKLIVIDKGNSCKGCGRSEAECSDDPCPDVIADRNATIADADTDQFPELEGTPGTDDLDPEPRRFELDAERDGVQAAAGQPQNQLAMF